MRQGTQVQRGPWISSHHIAHRSGGIDLHATTALEAYIVPLGCGSAFNFHDAAPTQTSAAWKRKTQKAGVSTNHRQQQVESVGRSARARDGWRRG